MKRSDDARVKARIRVPEDGGIAYIEIQRAKFKHWHVIGFHHDSDRMFRDALKEGTVLWLPKIIERTVFDKISR